MDGTLDDVRVPQSLSRVSGIISWQIKPPEEDIQIFRAIILDMIRKSGGINAVPDLTPPPPYTLEKISHKRALLKYHNETRQYYFKMFLPYFSWKWKRGLRIFSLPTLRQSVWFRHLQELGVGVVDLVGLAILPWKRQTSLLQPISIMITSSLIGTKDVWQIIKNNDLSLKQRTHIAQQILYYEEILHKNMIGHIDMLPKNILYDESSDEILLFDLDRFTTMKWWNKKRNILRDNRKVIKSMRLILS
jgi:serine/threonine protein kinase